MDGCRLIWNGESYFSRSGKKVDTMPFGFDTDGYIFDGELCRIDENGNEDFKDIVSDFKKKDYEIPPENDKGIVVYKVFDILTQEEFDSGTSKVILSERLKRLGPDYFVTKKYIQIVEQIKYEGILPDIKEGQEGWILRKDTFYKGKRSKDIIKVKRMEDTELKVIGIEETTKKFLVNEKMVEKRCVGALICKEAKVGTGISDEQRLNWMDGSIVGEVIKVKYMEKTKDKNGKESLRHPVFLSIRKQED
jgi:DNA ligase-1